MLETSNYINIGYLTKPHGVHGELNLVIRDQFVLTSLEPSFFMLMLNGGLVPFKCSSVRRKGQQTFLLNLDDCNSEAKAKELVQCEVYIDPKDLVEDEDNTSPSALVGYKVTDVRFGYVGVIDQIMEIAKNPLFQIDSNGKEVLIPIVDDFIVKIDKKKREITLKSPEGLIEMYLEE